MPYYPQPNVTDFTGLFYYTNEVTGYKFGILLLIAVWIITFMASKRYTSERAFTTASFLTMIAGVFFFLMGLISDLVMIVPIIMVASSIFLIYAREG